MLGQTVPLEVARVPLHAGRAPSINHCVGSPGDEGTGP